MVVVAACKYTHLIAVQFGLIFLLIIYLCSRLIKSEWKQKKCRKSWGLVMKRIALL